MKCLYVAVAAAVLSLAACRSSKDAVSVNDLDGEWNVVEIQGQAVQAESQPFIGFDAQDGRVYGYTGCNRLMGALTLSKPNKIELGQMASTLMACPDMETERLMLNIMQRMSGIATVTHKYMEELKGLKTKVLDTRKTTPGMRLLEKEAVKIGGGMNHRIGLFDMILLKDNHVDFAGGIANAINKCHDYLKRTGKDLKIEIEVRNLDELQQVLDLGGVDRIMFDNFTPELTKKAVEMVGGRYETESSGGITFANLRQYGECGVDYISVGALTHSVKGLDMSFKAC